jgi:hypothetical protein
VQPRDVGAGQGEVLGLEVFPLLAIARYPAQQHEAPRHRRRVPEVPLELFVVAPPRSPPQSRAPRLQIVGGEAPQEGTFGEGHRLGHRKVRLASQC